MDLKNTLNKLKQNATDTATSIAKTAKDGSALVAKKSSNLIEISKLTVSINSQESKIKEVYAEIGKKVCEKHENGLYIDPELVEDCDYILKLKSDINEMKEKIQALKSDDSAK